MQRVQHRVGRIEAEQRDDSLRSALRHRTQTLHETVEQRVEAARYFESSAGYQIWLAQMQHLHARYAKDYDIGAESLGMAPMSQNLEEALARDTGAVVPPASRAVLPRDHAIGVVYVFEGSAMGGRLLQRRLAEMAPVPTAYLDELVEASRTRWPQFKAACDRVKAADHDAAVAGAIEVFGTLRAMVEADCA